MAEEILNKQIVDYDYQAIWLEAVRRSNGNNVIFNTLMQNNREKYLNEKLSVQKESSTFRNI